jgi:PAS domain S-box-containing protein
VDLPEFGQTLSGEIRSGVKSCFESFCRISGWLILLEGNQMSSQAMRLENLLEEVPDALVGMDEAGMIRFVNLQTESLFGYDRDDMVGQPIQTLVPEYLWRIYREHREDYFADPLARSMGVDLRLIGRQQDGTEFPVNISLSRIDTGDVLLVLTAEGEVTKRKDALLNAQRMTSIVENSHEAIIGKNRDGIVTSWNRSAERLYGYSSQEIIGKSVDLLAPADRTDEVKSVLARIRAGQDVEHLETVRVRKDGAVIHVSLTISPMRDRNGAIIGASTITHDVTKARQAFEAARSMIESSLDALVAISPEGMITDVNEATVKVTGIPRGQLIGTAFSDCFTEPENAEKIYQLVFSEGMAVDYPLTMHHLDGRLTEVLYNASVYRDAGGKVLGVFAAARDVTKQNQAHREIASQRVNELDRLAELERFQRLTVGRELKMIELKKENEYLRKFGRAEGGDLGDHG